MRRRLQEKVNQYQAEIDTLNRTKQELVEGSSKIDLIIARLQREEVKHLRLFYIYFFKFFKWNFLITFQVDLQKNINVLRDKEQELEKSLDSLENSEGVDPDEAVTTTAPLYRQ